MKFVAIISTFMLLTTSAFACYDQAFSFYNQEMTARHHQDIHVHKDAVQLVAGEVYEMYGVKFEYDQNVMIYEGSSEFMSGFGVEAIVLEPNTCRLIEMVQVYSE